MRELEVQHFLFVCSLRHDFLEHKIIGKALKSCCLSLRDHSVFSVMDETAVAWTIEVGIYRIRRPIWVEPPVISRATALTSLEAPANLFQSFRRNR